MTDEELLNMYDLFRLAYDPESEMFVLKFPKDASCLAFHGSMYDKDRVIDLAIKALEKVRGTKILNVGELTGRSEARHPPLRRLLGSALLQGEHQQKRRVLRSENHKPEWPGLETRDLGGMMR